MPDIRTDCPTDSSDFKEAVCIDAGRVYDSCCDRDCLEDLRCYFTPEAQTYVNSAISVRLKSAEVLNVFIDVEPVSFNKGFYSCDLTFFFLVNLDLFTAPHTASITVPGICVFTKKVILYGSDGNVKVFSNAQSNNPNEPNHINPTSNMPKCVVQCVDPVPLTAHIGKLKDCFENVCNIPQSVCDCIGGNVVTSVEAGAPAVYVTIGLFTIVQLIRNVQMLIPVYDFCIPEKQCDNTTDQPCDVFRKLRFPTDDFFPPRPCNIGDECFGCSRPCE